MKRFIRLIVLAALLLVMSILASPQGGRRHMCAERPVTHSSITAANVSFESALRASDTEVMARLLAPDYIFITSDGEVRDRQELLRSYGAKEVRMQVFQSEGIKVRLYGEVGILTADITKEGEYMKGPRAGRTFTGRYRFTRVYACGPAGWQLVSTHESRLNP